jgi:uncharacterized membrane protein
MCSFSRVIASLSRIALVLLAVVLIPVQAAHAALVFCNRTQQPIEAALGYRGTLESGAEDWISEGWWRIEPGLCSRVYGEALNQRFYFDYAVALASSAHDRAPYIWSGKYQFCVDTKAFRVESDGDCEGRGYQTKGFQQIDVGLNTRDYTLEFKDSDAK